MLVYTYLVVRIQFSDILFDSYNSDHFLNVRVHAWNFHTFHELSIKNQYNILSNVEKQHIFTGYTLL